jgi:hypothetical protein
MTVNTTSRGGSLRINAMGSIGRFPEMYYADDLRHSIVAVADLLAQGYQVEFKAGGVIITHEDGHFIECVHMDGKAVWWVLLSPLFRPSVPFIGALGHGVPAVEWATLPMAS